MLSYNISCSHSTVVIIIIVGRPAAIDRRPLVLQLGSAILSAIAVVIQWSGSLF